MSKTDEALIATGKWLLIVLIFFLILFFSCILGSAFGALGGWIVGWFFSDTIALALKAFHIGALEPWQLGAFLGFVGGFFRSYHHHKDKD